MIAGNRRVALVLALALPASAAAQGFEYAPGTGTYRVTQNTTAAQDIMGQKNEVQSSSNQVVTITLNRSAKDTVTMNIVLDSISSTNSLGMPTNLIDRYIGLKVAAKLSPVGAYYSAEQAGTPDPAAAGMVESMGRILPQLRGKLALGDAWVDTISSKIAANGMEIERKTVSRFKVEGDSTVGSEKALKITRSDSTALSGSGNGPNGPMTMEGVTKGNGAIVVSPKGVFLGATGTEEATMKIVLSSNGMEVGVNQTSTTRIEKIR